MWGWPGGEDTRPRAPPGGEPEGDRIPGRWVAGRSAQRDPRISVSFKIEIKRTARCLEPFVHGNQEGLGGNEALVKLRRLSDAICVLDSCVFRVREDGAAAYRADDNPAQHHAPDLPLGTEQS